MMDMNSEPIVSPVLQNSHLDLEYFICCLKPEPYWEITTCVMHVPTLICCFLKYKVGFFRTWIANQQLNIWRGQLPDVQSKHHSEEEKGFT